MKHVMHLEGLLLSLHSFASFDRQAASHLSIVQLPENGGDQTQVQNLMQML